MAMRIVSTLTPNRYVKVCPYVMVPFMHSFSSLPPAIRAIMLPIPLNVHLKIAVMNGLDAMSAHVSIGHDDSYNGLNKLPPDLQAQLAEVSDPDNLLILVVDDAKMLFVQPLKSDTIMATWTTNRGMVILTKFSIEAWFKDSIYEPAENCTI